MSAHPRLRLIVPSPELKEELKERFGVCAEVLPHPSTTFHDAEIKALGAVREPSASRPLTVVFPGNLRGGKGFELTSRAIREMLKAKDVNFHIRLRFPPQDSVNKARMEFFDSVRDRVEIMDSYLDEHSFRDLLLSADLVVLPYTADRFGNRTSGLLVDSLLLGTPCIVIEGTWLARTVSEYGFGLVSAKDGVSLARRVLEGLTQIDKFKQAAAEGRDRYLVTNSWNSLIEFLISHPQSNPEQPAPAMVAQAPRRNNAPRRILLIGNGPSTRVLAEAGMHNLPDDMDTIGTTCAFRYFEQIGWWPTYYALADRKVVFHHREVFARLLADPKVTTKKFYLSWEISKNERLEVIPHSSTGSFSLKKAVELGYREIYLIGMEGAYVEEILESRALSDDEIDQMGFGVLNLSIKERRLRVIDATPTDNPNYFFPGYQLKGDVYSQPQAHTHQANWESVANVVREAGAKVINLSRISKIDAFERGDIRKVFDFVPDDCWDEIPDPFSEQEQHVKCHFVFSACPAFERLSDTVWRYTSDRHQLSQLRAIFPHVGITEGRNLVGGFRVIANRSVTILINLCRHGNDSYEGTSKRVTLKSGEPVIVEQRVAFKNRHKEIRLQITVVDLPDGDKVELTLDGIYLTESVESVVVRCAPDELTVQQADRAFREGKHSFALATYLYLAAETDLPLYCENAIAAAKKIGIPDPENVLRLFTPSASLLLPKNASLITIENKTNGADSKWFVAEVSLAKANGLMRSTQIEKAMEMYLELYRRRLCVAGVNDPLSKLYESNALLAAKKIGFTEMKTADNLLQHLEMRGGMGA